MSKAKLLLLIILIAGLISACKKDEDSNGKEAILNPSTIIIDSMQGSELTDYDTAKLGFNQGASITDEIKIGSIVVSGPQQLAPNGFLRRIISADTVSGRVIYTTEHAKLSDAFEQAEFNVTATFDPSEVIPLDSAVTITALKKEAATFQYLVQVELKDNANNAFTVDLTVNLDPSFEIESRIRGGMYVRAVLNMNGDWEIKGTASTQLGPFQFRKPLFRPRNIARQTVWIPTPFAGIPAPVVINEDFVIYLVGQVSIDGSVTIGVTAEFESSLGVEYTDGSFNKIVQFNASTPQPFVSAQVSAKGRLGIWPVVIVSAYDQHFGKIEIGPEGYLEASAFLSTGSQSCRLDYGVDLNISFAAPIFTDNTWDPTLPPIYGPKTLLSNFCAGNPCVGFFVSTSVSGTSLTANPSGGTSPYSYNWSNGNTTQTISGLSNGTYTVTATDNEGCTATASGTVGVDPCQSNPVSVTADVSGTSIAANPSGGSSPYSYSWSNGETTQTISGLNNGSYTVTLTDGNGCTATATGTVGVDPCIANPLTISVSVSDDEITLSRSGASPYDYSWSGPNGFTSTDRNLSGLSPGTYCVTVTDANQCTATDCGTVVGQFPMIIFNAGTQPNRVRSSRDSTSLTNIVTRLAIDKKVVAKEQIGNWYRIDIPWNGVGDAEERWSYAAPTYMEPTSGNCIKITGNNAPITNVAGGTNMLVQVSSGNYTPAEADVDQYYVYTSTTTSGAYTWYKIDLPDYCYTSNYAQQTTGWISSQHAVIGNCY